MHGVIPKLTIGVDLSDRYCHLHLLDASGECIEENRVRTTSDALRQRFAAVSRARVLLEAGTHFPWVSRLMKELGHEVIRGKPRAAPYDLRERRKIAPSGAEYLARIGRLGPALLKGIEHRGEKAQADLTLIWSRDALVRARGRLINHCRGVVKSLGGRLPACSGQAFHRKVREHVPVPLEPALGRWWPPESGRGRADPRRPTPRSTSRPPAHGSPTGHSARRSP